MLSTIFMVNHPKCTQFGFSPYISPLLFILGKHRFPERTNVVIYQATISITGLYISSNEPDLVANSYPSLKPTLVPMYARLKVLMD